MSTQSQTRQPTTAPVTQQPQAPSPSTNATQQTPATAVDVLQNEAKKSGSAILVALGSSGTNGEGLQGSQQSKKMHHR